MLDIMVRRYDGTLPLFSTLPTPCNDVVFVDVMRGSLRHTLSGFDNYWVADEHFGMFNDPGNEHVYTGLQRVAYRWSGDTQEFLTDTRVPEGALVMQGVMLPEHHARAVGLL